MVRSHSGLYSLSLVLDQFQSFDVAFEKLMMIEDDHLKNCEMDIETQLSDDDDDDDDRDQYQTMEEYELNQIIKGFGGPKNGYHSREEEEKNE